MIIKLRLYIYIVLGIWVIEIVVYNVLGHVRHAERSSACFSLNNYIKYQVVALNYLITFRHL